MDSKFYRDDDFVLNEQAAPCLMLQKSKKSFFAKWGFCEKFSTISLSKLAKWAFCETRQRFFGIRG